MRFGLVGTSYWARETHAAALAAVDGVEFVGVWGRDPGKAQELADHAGVRRFDDPDALFDAVDAVAFSVPPDVQVGLAERAAQRGRHLFLEKPVALSSRDAGALAAAVRAAGVASVVFFTDRFTPEGRDWLAAVQGRPWEGGAARWLANAFADGSPFATPWRRDSGGLWDVGPHALSLLTAALGRVRKVHAVAGVRDLVHLVLQHDGGATSTAALSLTTPRPACQVSLELWGPAGTSHLPMVERRAVLAAQTALRDLIAAAAGTGPGGGGPAPTHPCDVEFGRDVVDVLDQAQRQLDAARSDPASSPR
jgi:predicted dehydrogenase